MIDTKFDRMLEIMTHFKTNGIRQQGKNLELVIEFQDIIGRSTNDQIAEAWNKLDPSQKNIFLWSVSCCVGQEITVMVVEATLGRDAKRKVLKQFKDEYDRLEAEEVRIGDRLHAVEKREQEVRATVEAHTKIYNILNELPIIK
jgi:hypothetical protein